MGDNELFEKLEELIKLSDPDNACSKLAIEKRDKLWNEVTKDIRNNTSHFLIMYINMLIDKGKINEDSIDVSADRILTNLYYCVMEDLKKIFNTKEK